MLNEQTRHRIRLARRATALAGYELTNDDPGVSARDIYKAVSRAQDALEDALEDVVAAREAIEGLPDDGRNGLASVEKLGRVAAREARASVEGDNARCAECDAYYDQFQNDRCPYCGCDFHWNLED
jgi:hypothetical protein